MLEVYQREFLEISLEVSALKFGSFSLKSGRVSPYFFNAGAFCDGKSLNVVAKSYAEVVYKAYKNLDFSVIFGPAYKGIPLVAAISLVLERDYGLNFSWSFNRKEIKDHGEGGILVGSSLKGKKVLIIDDVLTAGTAVRETIKLLKIAEADPVGLVVALDRKEKAAKSNSSALELLSLETGISVFSIVNLDNLLVFVENNQSYAKYLPELKKYRLEYGIN